MLEIEMRTNRRLNCLQMFRNLENKDCLVWLTTEKGVRVNICKKDIRREIGRLLFTESRRTILTSATITSQNSGTLSEKYRYFLNNLGCPNNVCVSEPKKSPYNYDKHSIKGEKEMYYVSNTHPAIISRELYETAQKLMENRCIARKSPISSPFKRKILCKSCGSIYQHKISQKTSYWVCKKHDDWNCQEMCSRRIPKILDMQISGSVMRELL